MKGTSRWIIVAGALIVDPDGRDAYVEGCVSVVASARDQLAALLNIDVNEYTVVERPG